MIMLVWVNPSPPVRTDYERGFNTGAAQGTFDAVNERDIRDFSNVEETDYNAGYIDGYVHNFSAFC